MLKATSTAPPPATTFPDSKVLLATQIESWSDLKLMIKIPFDFIKHVFVGSSKNNGTSS